MIDQPTTNTIPLDISVIVSQRNGAPAVELRRVTSDIEIMKLLIACAFHNRPVILQPTFTNRMQSLNTLIEKGLLYRGQDGQFYWTL